MTCTEKIVRAWRHNELSWRVALNRLVQECGLNHEAAAQLLARS